MTTDRASLSNSSGPLGAAAMVGGFAPQRVRVVVALGLFLAAHFLLQIFAYTQKSATFDEPLHLTAGYHALRGDYRVDPTHPPLLRQWAALPLLAMHDVSANSRPMDETDSKRWLFRSFNYAHLFLYAGHDADRLLDAGRFMMVTLSALLGVLIFCWLLEWLGFWPAVAGLGCFLIEPNLSAHAALVTTDAGVTLFYFGTIYFLWRLSRAFGAFNLAALALCFSFAIVSKFSAVLLAPIVAGLLAIALVDRRTTLTARRVGVTLVVLALTAYAMIWAVYGFRYAPSHSPDWLFRSSEFVKIDLHYSFVNRVLNWIDAHRLLPNAFTQGFVISFATVAPMGGYLGGEISTGGWWYYFPVAFLIKTPVSLLAFMAVGVAFAALRFRRFGLLTLVFIGLPAAIYFAAAMNSSINIGLRHVLPVYPFAVLIGVLGITELARWSHPAKWPVILVPVGLWLVTFIAVYPHTLTFFNRLVGGPAQGQHYLADSNLDWGQHLKLLKNWMRAHDVDHINLAYFGMADPGYYEIDFSYLPGSPLGPPNAPPPRLPGYVAIGATILSGVHLRPEWRTYYRGFAEQRPVAVLGHSLNIYWVDQWPGIAASEVAPITESEIQRLREVGDLLYDRKKWYAHAALYYAEYAKHRPRDARVGVRLGRCFLETARDEEALRIFETITAEHATDGAIHRQIAAHLLNHRQFAAAVDYAARSRALLPASLRSRILHELALAALKDPASARIFSDDESAAEPVDDAIKATR